MSSNTDQPDRSSWFNYDLSDCSELDIISEGETAAQEENGAFAKITYTRGQLAELLDLKKSDIYNNFVEQARNLSEAKEYASKNKEFEKLTASTSLPELKKLDKNLSDVGKNMDMIEPLYEEVRQQITINQTTYEEKTLKQKDSMDKRNEEIISQGAVMDKLREKGARLRKNQARMEGCFGSAPNFMDRISCVYCMLAMVFVMFLMLGLQLYFRIYGISMGNQAQALEVEKAKCSTFLNNDGTINSASHDKVSTSPSSEQSNFYEPLFEQVAGDVMTGVGAFMILPALIYVGLYASATVNDKEKEEAIRLSRADGQRRKEMLFKRLERLREEKEKILADKGRSRKTLQIQRRIEQVERAFMLAGGRKDLLKRKIEIEENMAEELANGKWGKGSKEYKRVEKRIAKMKKEYESLPEGAEPEPSMKSLMAGKVFSNWKWYKSLWHYFSNNHPILSCFFAHPLHPINRSERVIIFINSLLICFICVTFSEFQCTVRNNDVVYEPFTCIEKGTCVCPNANTTSWINAQTSLKAQFYLGDTCGGFTCACDNATMATLSNTTLFPAGVREIMYCSWKVCQPKACDPSAIAIQQTTCKSFWSIFFSSTVTTIFAVLMNTFAACPCVANMNDNSRCKTCCDTYGHLMMVLISGASVIMTGICVSHTVEK
eukprot:g4024.t1